MENVRSSDITKLVLKENTSAVADKEELVANFDQLSDEAKSRFYEDCKKGISPEELRQALHQKIRQLWLK